MPTPEQIMKVIAENLPSPYGLDIVWRQTNAGPVFDLTDNDERTVEEWTQLAAAVRSLFEQNHPSGGSTTQ